MLFEKVSFDITKNLRGNAFFLWTPTSSTGRLAGYNGECPNCSTASLAAAQVNKTIGYFAPQSNYGIDLTWMANPTTLFAVKAGRFWDNYKDTGLPFVTPINYSTTALGLPFTAKSPRLNRAAPASTTRPAFSSRSMTSRPVPTFRATSASSSTSSAPTISRPASARRRS